MPDDQSGYENAIPAAVRRQSQRADEMFRQAQAEAEGGAPATGVEGQQGALTPEHAPEPLVETPTSNTVVAEPTVAEPQQPPAGAGENWEQKFRSLQGRFDSQVVETNARARAAEQRVQQLENLIATMNMPSAAPAQPEPRQEIRRSQVEPTEQELAEYGPDLIAASRRWARMEVDPVVDELRAKISRLEGGQQKTTDQIAHEALLGRLTAAMPDWERVNNDPAFKDWLNVYEEFAGQTRLSLAQAAFNARDAQRVLSFFRRFQAEHTAVPRTETSPAHTPTGAGTVPLEHLAAPGRARPTSPGAQVEKRIIPRAEIVALYTDITRGRFANNPAEAERRKAEIDQAMQEGRIG